MSTRLTAQRLARLIAGADAVGVSDAVTTQPQLLAATRVADPAASGGEAPDEVPDEVLDGDPLSRLLVAAGATH